MSDTYLEVLRPGINTTIQDIGRFHFYHIGITVSGAMDQSKFQISNALVSNNLNEGVIEFAYQGPCLKLVNGNTNIAITGDIDFKILRKNSTAEDGICFKNYFLEDGDQIDIISTKNSVFGYFAVEGGFKMDRVWDSLSINTKAKVGPNNGEKFSQGQKIYINKSKIQKFSSKKIDYNFSNQKVIRVIKGTNYNYFSENALNTFFKEEYTVSKLSDRMGMRLEGTKLENIIATNIKSEGLVKGVIQVPADGKPIILFCDHGTIGGYPKIAVVISADYDKVVQLPPGSKIHFKEVSLINAEKYFQEYVNSIEKHIREVK